jgi:RHH-type rel operon transcriptional repressor/antitoxin RelB
MLTVRLPKQLESRLDAIAKKTGRTKSHLAREAIAEHIADFEDYYLADVRYMKIVSGASRSAPLDRVKSSPYLKCN